MAKYTNHEIEDLMLRFRMWLIPKVRTLSPTEIRVFLEQIKEVCDELLSIADKHREDEQG